MSGEHGFFNDDAQGEFATASTFFIRIGLDIERVEKLPTPAFRFYIANCSW